jgi:predicted RNA methylase
MFETQKYLKKFYNNLGIKEINGFQIDFDLPKTYKFHKKGKFRVTEENKTISVICLEVVLPQGLKVINFEENK